MSEELLFDENKLDELAFMHGLNARHHIQWFNFVQAACKSAQKAAVKEFAEKVKERVIDYSDDAQWEYPREVVEDIINTEMEKS